MRLAALLALLMGCASPPGSLEGDAGRTDVPRRDAPSSDTGSDAGGDTLDAAEGDDAPDVPIDAGPPAEDCANDADDDLDGAADCLDSDCEGRACDDGSPCTAGDLCAAGSCVGERGPLVWRCIRRGGAEDLTFDSTCTDWWDCAARTSDAVWRVPPAATGRIVTLNQWRPAGCAACGLPDGVCADSIVDVASASPAPATYCAETPTFGNYPTDPAPGLIAVRRISDGSCRHGLRSATEMTPAGMVDEGVLAYVCPP